VHDMGSNPEPGSGRPERSWRVGDLARASGLTVRALHHYDHIGLLTPSGRTPAGHRAYSDGDLARLYRISLLRRLGFPLGQIAAMLDDPRWQLGPAVRQHLDDTRRRATAAAQLCVRLAKMAAGLDQQQHPAAEHLLAALEEMTMLDGTPAQHHEPAAL
jgi:DNA-binding transcriptional MerR regulator